MNKYENIAHHLSEASYWIQKAKQDLEHSKFDVHNQVHAQQCVAFVMNDLEKAEEMLKKWV